MTATLDVPALLTEGVALLIAEAAIGVYRGDGSAYLPGETAIVFGEAAQQPTRVIALTPYVVEDYSGEENDSTVAVQVRVRGDADPFSASGVASDVFGVLQNLHGITLNGVALVHMSRYSSIPAGRDATGRWQQFDNYYAQVAWPTPHRPD